MNNTNICFYINYTTVLICRYSMVYFLNSLSKIQFFHFKTQKIKFIILTALYDSMVCICSNIFGWEIDEHRGL